jgi:hypothetical protein
MPLTSAALGSNRLEVLERNLGFGARMAENDAVALDRFGAVVLITFLWTARCLC